MDFYNDEFLSKLNKTINYDRAEKKGRYNGF